MKKITIFPLARLGPLGFLTAFAIASTVLILSTGNIADAWAWVGLLPLVTYLGFCQIRARKIIGAEVGREREIVQMGFIVMAADRAARFWSVASSAVAIATVVTSIAIWAYQGALWFLEDRWIPLTWRSVIGLVPQSDHTTVQQSYLWLSNTNIGVIILISGLLVAAPLATISWRSNNKAKFRHNELGNLKKRS